MTGKSVETTTRLEARSTGIGSTGSISITSKARSPSTSRGAGVRMDYKTSAKRGTFWTSILSLWKRSRKLTSAEKMAVLQDRMLTKQETVRLQMGEKSLLAVGSRYVYRRS